MYAVIKTGGKQYRVVPGETLKVELLPGAVGDIIHFDQVLMLHDGSQAKIGLPYVEGGKVQAEIVRHDKAEKIRIIKFRRRKNSKTIRGHRQPYTEVKIIDIKAA